MNDIKLKITRHAKEKMIIPGISKEQVKRAIQHGAKTRQTDGYLVSYTYLKVSYKVIGENCHKIKTVFVG